MACIEVAREVEFEGRSSPRLALQPDRSATLLHDPEDRRQPEPRVAHAGHDEAAGRNLDVLSGKILAELAIGGLDQQRAAARHRVAGIEGQVHHQLLELPGIGANCVEVARLEHLVQVAAWCGNSKGRPQSRDGPPALMGSPLAAWSLQHHHPAIAGPLRGDERIEIHARGQPFPCIASAIPDTLVHAGRQGAIDEGAQLAA